MSLMQFPSRLLFKVTADCPYVRQPLSAAPEDWPGGLLPALSELDGEQSFARVWTSWNQRGLFVAAEIPKQGVIVGNRRRPSSGDGMQLWIDTQAQATGHRANQYCYHFIILPQTPGHNGPLIWQEHIRRAYGRPPICNPEAMHVSVARGEGSYRMVVELPAAECLDFTPQAGRELGFTYLIHDTSSGRQVWSCPHQAPYANDPSYWGYLRLVK